MHTCLNVERSCVYWEKKIRKKQFERDKRLLKKEIREKKEEHIIYLIFLQMCFFFLEIIIGVYAINWWNLINRMKKFKKLILCFVQSVSRWILSRENLIELAIFQNLKSIFFKFLFEKSIKYSTFFLNYHLSWSDLLKTNNRTNHTNWSSFVCGPFVINYYIFSKTKFILELFILNNSQVIPHRIRTVSKFFTIIYFKMIPEFFWLTFVAC